MSVLSLSIIQPIFGKVRYLKTVNQGPITGVLGKWLKIVYGSRQMV